MDLLSLIKNRRTIRKYKDEKVSEKVIQSLLEAGRWAPSAHNLQPWKFLVIDRKDNITKIADIMDKKADELFSGFNIVMRDTAKNIRQAQALLLVYGTGAVTKKFTKFGPPYAEIGNTYEIQSVANAIENILLYAKELNIGIAWYGMGLFCEHEISSLFRQKDRLLAILSLGYADESPSALTRKELKEIVQFIR